MKYKFCMVYGPNKVILVAFYHTRNSCEASSIFFNITQDLRGWLRSSALPLI